MELYKKPRDLMAQDGKGILRSLQNESLPYIDLIVRESLQNSLDATLKSKMTTEVNIDINDFETSQVSKHFEGIEEVLNRRYQSNETALIIRDRNTSGLDGTIDFNETTNDADIRKSKFYKLVYGLSMNQDERGAGGSWGLGKTSYFRIGNGLVIYYTRVKDSITGNYESRLAASLIEDPNMKNPLLESSLGLAWWGTKNSESNTKTIPITNESKINEFIDHFNIVPYKNDETGTTIIIPFLNKEKLIRNNSTNSTSKLRKEFILAIQRWYYPRLLNDEYTKYIGNSKLVISVNDTKLDVESLPKTFKIFRKLYNSALIGNPIDKEIQVNDIKGLQNVLDNPKNILGRVAFITVPFSKLEIVGPDRDLTPLEYVGLSKPDLSSEGQGILAYMRKPGMVVEYANAPTPWMKKVNIPDNHYLFAVFVPSSNEKMKRSKYITENYNYEFLEDYLRDTENADHALWLDKTIGIEKFTIVKRLQDYVSREIKNYTDKNDDKQIISKSSEMSRQMGKKFLPPIGYGKAGSSLNSRSTSNKLKKHEKSNYINIEDISKEDVQNVIIQVKVGLVSGRSLISLEISTQEGLLDITKWDKQLDNRIKYPFIIKNVELLNDNTHEKLIIKKITDASFEVINDTNKFSVYTGKIEFKINDLNMQPSLQIKFIEMVVNK